MSASDGEALARLVEEAAERRAAGQPVGDAAGLARRYGLEASVVQDALAGLAALDGLTEAPPRGSGTRHLPTPELPDDYSILEELGRGGMGVVYRAFQASLQREVAIKVLRPAELLLSEAIERFGREARMLARLRHPNIAAIHEVGEAGGALYFSMELISGGTLADFLEKRRRPVPLAQAVKLMRQVVGAIAFVHAHGMVHRDLKPANVLLDGDGDAHVVDFGLAVDASVGATLTATGRVMGTPGYMAPEQALGNRAEVTERTDIYSLGVMLYELIAGEAPFAGRSIVDTIHAVVHGDPTPPSKLRPELPADLERIVMKAMHRDPAKRYGTANALGKDLARFADGRRVEAKAPGPVARAGTLVRRHPRKALVAMAAVAALVGAVIAPEADLERARATTRLETIRSLETAGQFAAADQLYAEAASGLGVLGADDTTALDIQFGAMSAKLRAFDEDPSERGMADLLADAARFRDQWPAHLEPLLVTWGLKERTDAIPQLAEVITEASEVTDSWYADLVRLSRAFREAPESSVARFRAAPLLWRVLGQPGHPLQVPAAWALGGYEHLGLVMPNMPHQVDATLRAVAPLWRAGSTLDPHRGLFGDPEVACADVAKSIRTAMASPVGSEVLRSLGEQCLDVSWADSRRIETSQVVRRLLGLPVESVTGALEFSKGIPMADVEVWGRLAIEVSDLAEPLGAVGMNRAAAEVDRVLGRTESVPPSLLRAAVAWMERLGFESRLVQGASLEALCQEARAWWAERSELGVRGVLIESLGLNPGDLSGSLESRRSLLDLLHDVSETPRIARQVHDLLTIESGGLLRGLSRPLEAARWPWFFGEFDLHGYSSRLPSDLLDGWNRALGGPPRFRAMRVSVATIRWPGGVGQPVLEGVHPAGVQDLSVGGVELPMSFTRAAMESGIDHVFRGTLRRVVQVTPRFSGADSVLEVVSLLAIRRSGAVRSQELLAGVSGWVQAVIHGPGTYSIGEWVEPAESGEGDRYALLLRAEESNSEDHDGIRPTDESLNGWRADLLSSLVSRVGAGRSDDWRTVREGTARDLELVARLQWTMPSSPAESGRLRDLVRLLDEVAVERSWKSLWWDARAKTVQLLVRPDEEGPFHRYGGNFRRGDDITPVSCPELFAASADPDLRDLGRYSLNVRSSPVTADEARAIRAAEMPGGESITVPPQYERQGRYGRIERGLVPFVRGMGLLAFMLLAFGGRNSRWLWAGLVAAVIGAVSTVLVGEVARPATLDEARISAVLVALGCGLTAAEVKFGKRPVGGVLMGLSFLCAEAAGRSLRAPSWHFVEATLVAVACWIVVLRSACWGRGDLVWVVRALVFVAGLFAAACAIVLSLEPLGGGNPDMSSSHFWFSLAGVLRDQGLDRTAPLVLPAIGLLILCLTVDPPSRRLARARA